jgi:hypothetical protein
MTGLTFNHTSGLRLGAVAEEGADLPRIVGSAQLGAVHEHRRSVQGHSRRAE